MNRGARLLLFGLTTDPGALAWAAAVTANGGTYSAATLAAVNTFCKSAKAAGVWTKLNRINLFCGDQLAAALVPLLVGGGSATETNVNFVSGDYTEATGLTGNGTTKYLRTGMIPSASLTPNDTHLSVYNRAGAATPSAFHIAAFTGGAAAALNFGFPFSGSATSDQYNATIGAGRKIAAVTTPFGHGIASRTASNAHNIYKAGASIATSATSGGGLPAVELFVCAANNAGTANNYSADPVAAYSAGSGLTANDAAAYYTALQAFQTALGRNV